MNHSVSSRVLRDIIISGVLLLAVVVFLSLNATQFSGTLHILARTPLDLVALGLALVAGTYFAAAMSYVALGSSKNVRLGRTFGIQVVSGITNRLLPAGLGGAGLYVLYFKRSGYDMPTATALVATNNILGAIGNFILLVPAVVWAPREELSWRLPSVSVIYIVLIVAVIAACVVAFLLRGAWMDKIKKFVRETLVNLRSALKPSRRTLVSLISNMSLTALNGLILSVTVTASGGHMFWPLTIAVLSLGAVLGAAVPTPGGLGGVEAGIVGGLVACGVPAAPALAATLLYRVLTYWLPIIPGVIMLPWIRKQYLK